MRTHMCRSVVLVLMFAAGCTTPQEPGARDGKAEADKAQGTKSSSRATSDVCDLSSLGTAMFACLLPESDPRHDPSKRLAADVDCYWQAKAPIDKELRTDATGAVQTFTFEVENKCAKADVLVEFRSPSGSLSNWYCPLEQMPVPSGKRNTFICYTNYSIGATTLSRGYTLRVFNVNGQLVPPVDLDPEVVLEKSGGDRLIPEFKKDGAVNQALGVRQIAPGSSSVAGRVVAGSCDCRGWSTDARSTFRSHVRRRFNGGRAIAPLLALRAWGRLSGGRTGSAPVGESGSRTRNQR